MQYAKLAKRSVGSAGAIFNESDLNMVQQEKESAHKRDQLIMLNQKVKQFEQKVARDEMLVRNNAGGGAATEGNAGVANNAAILDAQTQVND